MPEIMFGLVCMIPFAIRDSFKSVKSFMISMSALLGSYLVYRRMIPKSKPKEKTRFIYVGCYTAKMGHILGDQVSEGIYVFKLGDDGSLT